MPDLSKVLADMILTDRYGIYHVTNEGICSWYEFACEIVRQANVDARVIPVSSEEYQAKAKRPSNSRMSKDALDQNGFSRLPHWQDALSRYLEETQNH
jgi:dTDP-4-dehydrorhamnose reductase